jgi:hypothetical protein
MKETSVEWMIKRLTNLNLIKEGTLEKELFETIKCDAKNMHKDELKKLFLKNDNSISIDTALERFEDYYNETFKNK